MENAHIWIQHFKKICQGYFPTLGGVPPPSPDLTSSLRWGYPPTPPHWRMQGPGFWGHMVSAQREPITGVWGRPQRGPVAEPSLARETGGEAPEAELLFALSQPEESSKLS